MNFFEKIGLLGFGLSFYVLANGGITFNAKMLLATMGLFISFIFFIFGGYWTDEKS